MSAAHDAAREIARSRLGPQDQVETYAQCMDTEHGTYVAAWLWVPKITAPQEWIDEAVMVITETDGLEVP